MRGRMIGSGGDGIDIEQLTASPSEVLEGQVFYGEGSEEMQYGTMPDRPAVDTSPGMLVFGELLKVYLYRGAHIRDGSDGYPEVHIPFSELVQAIGLTADMLRNGSSIAGLVGTYGSDGNLTPETLVAGKVGYGANGRVAGEAADRGSVNKTLLAGERYDIAKGFYGNGVIAAKDLASQTGGTAGAGDVLKNKTAWVNGSKVTGNIESKEEEVFYVNPDDRTIPAARYTSGVQTIKGVKTENISAGNIKKGVRVRVGDSNNYGRITDITGTFAGTLILSGWWYKGTITDHHEYGWEHHGEYHSNQLVNNQEIGPGTLTIRESDYRYYHPDYHRYGMMAFGFGGFWYVKCSDTSQSSIYIPFYGNVDDYTIQIGI